MKNIVAVIDVGTLKTKFEVRDYSSEKNGKLLHRDKFLTVLGRDLDKTGNLIIEKSIKITTEALLAIKSKMKELDVVSYKAVTTEAIRRAKNAIEVLEKIKDKTGIELITLTHQEEAKILFESISKDFKNRIIAVADIGGGSVQLVIGKNNQCNFILFDRKRCG